MKEEHRDLARAFDELEDLYHSGKDPESLDDPDLAADLRVLQVLEATSEPEPMPRAPEFTRNLMKSLRRPRFRPIYGYLAVAAALLVAFILVPPQPQQSGPVMVDEELLERAMASETREALHQYLVNSEKLLLSIRGADLACSEDEMDLGLEKQWVRDLLVKQKLIDSQLGHPEYYQARHLVKELERILVDINSMDVCSDPMEIEFINEHVAQERLLMKLRLIAQNIQVS